MRFFSLLSVLLFALVLTGPTAAQSTNQNFPTPVTSNEIEGTIKARDVGDARVTSYYYQFDAGQGDLFINVVTRNLTADIDVFTQTGLKPLTKIVVYGDLAENETGRVLYFRKPEKLILRIQGRTPGDEAATFRIKFAGSFVASTETESPAEPTLPKLTAKNESGIKVNSVGTIVEVIPKATPTPAAIASIPGANPDERDQDETEKEKPSDVTAAQKSDEKPADTSVEDSEKKVEVVVTDNVTPKTETVTPPKSTRTARGRRTPAPPVATVIKPKPDKTETAEETSPRRTKPPKTTTEKAPDPLEKINLVIQFKDGSVIERPMSEVLRFSVDKGILTVIAKDGSIGRYNILVVEKVTIQ